MEVAPSDREVRASFRLMWDASHVRSWHISCLRTQEATHDAFTKGQPEQAAQ